MAARRAPARTAGALASRPSSRPRWWRRSSVPTTSRSASRASRAVLDEVARYSSTWRDYLFTAGALHYAAWSHRFAGGLDRAVPRRAPRVALAGVALAAKPGLARPARPDGGGHRRGRRRAVVRARAAGLRAPLPVASAAAGRARRRPDSASSRSSAVAVLAGFGVAALQQRWGARRWWPRAGRRAPARRPRRGSARAPVDYRAVRRHPAHLRVAARARGHGRRRVPLLLAGADLPQRAVRAELDGALEAARQRLQRIHARQLSPARGRARPTSPTTSPRELLRALGVSHVVVHFDAYGGPARDMAAACAAAPWLARSPPTGTGSAIYRVVAFDVFAGGLDDDRLRLRWASATRPWRRVGRARGSAPPYSRR